MGIPNFVQAKYRKGIKMMKITFLSITFFMSVTNFGAAIETDNDLMRKIPACPYCPDYAPYCYGFCEKEFCDGQCLSIHKPPKVSISEKLAALTSALHSLAFGDAAGNTVSLFNNGVCSTITVHVSSTE